MLPFGSTSAGPRLDLEPGIDPDLLTRLCKRRPRHIDDVIVTSSLTLWASAE
jgi:hypothetical protein